MRQTLDTQVERFRTRKLEGSYAYRQLDPTFAKVRHNDHRVGGMAVVIAVGVNQDGQRAVLGLDVEPSEDGAFWLAFLRSPVATEPARRVPRAARQRLLAARRGAVPRPACRPESCRHRAQLAET